MMGIDSCGMLISAVHHENGEEKLAFADGRSSHSGRRKALLIVPKLSALTPQLTPIYSELTPEMRKENVPVI